MNRCSRIPGFYKLTPAERRARLREAASLGPDELGQLEAPAPLDFSTADHMIENVVGTYALPLGIALNLRLNQRDYLVPMVIEEPSVVAAASNAARMVREGGGFSAEADDPIMIGQVLLSEVADTTHAAENIASHREEICALADAAQSGLVRRGGGTRGLEVRILEPATKTAPGLLVVHLYVDCRDAMGANLVNTIAEAVADRLAELSSGQVGLRILSNLADRRCVRVRCNVPLPMLSTNGHNGAAVARGIAEASRFAELDPYRAATHNKGIMNGIDAVALACGNDWRGIEAGAHAFAARSGVYRPLAIWRMTGAELEGYLELPMPVGTVGGCTRVHPGAKLSLALLGAESATELGMVIAAVGLASNLAALRALATEGIQRGHMSLHARTVALRVGATGDQVEQVARELAALGEVRADRARLILDRLVNRSPSEVQS